MRKLVSHAFSEQALREQEPLIQQHIISLGQQFEKFAKSSTEVNLDVWVDRLSFDILSDLTFGESFDDVKNDTSNTFIGDCYEGCKMLPVFVMKWDYAVVNWLLMLMFNIPSIKQKMAADEAAAKDRVNKWFNSKNENRKDFMTYITRYDDERGVTRGELEGLTVVFMAAGGEEPASLITGCLWFLLKNPETLKVLQKELDEAFEKHKTVTNLDLSKLPFLDAVIRETARIRPPTSGHFNRRTNRPEVLDGHLIPAGISVEVSPYAASHSISNFADPDQYVPDRWLPTPPSKYSKDDLNASQPFSTGPRQCLGKNLARLMVRTSLAYLVWGFDMALSEKSRDWGNGQKLKQVWLRPGLFVTLTSRKSKESEGQGLMGLAPLDKMA